MLKKNPASLVNPDFFLGLNINPAAGNNRVNMVTWMPWYYVNFHEACGLWNLGNSWELFSQIDWLLIFCVNSFLQTHLIGL